MLSFCTLATQKRRVCVHDVPHRNWKPFVWKKWIRVHNAWLTFFSFFSSCVFLPNQLKGRYDRYTTLVIKQHNIWHVSLHKMFKGSNSIQVKQKIQVATIAVNGCGSWYNIIQNIIVSCKSQVKSSICFSMLFTFSYNISFSTLRSFKQFFTISGQIQRGPKISCVYNKI